MQVVNNQNEASKPEAKPIKKSHLRLKIDIQTWHLTTFKETLNLGPNNGGVTGWQAGFLCFVLMFTKKG